MDTSAPDKFTLVKWHEDSAALRDLLHQPGWDTLSTYWNALTQHAIETLINGSAPGPATDWQKGYVAGLRKAAQTPHEIIKNTGQARAH